MEVWKIWGKDEEEMRRTRGRYGDKMERRVGRPEGEIRRR